MNTLTRSRQWLAVASAGVISLGWVLPAWAQERLIRTLTVTGQGVEFVETTLAQVRLGVEVQAKTAAAAQQEAAQRANAVVDLLRSRQVERLETTGITLSPNYRYDDGKQTLVGYTASNLVSFRVPNQTAGALLDDAVKAGATRIDSLSFVATDSAIASVQTIALRKATQDAQRQADAVLAALNLSRQEIIGIQINNASTPPPRPVPADSFAGQGTAKAQTPVVGGDQRVETSVTLQIRY